MSVHTLQVSYKAQSQAWEIFAVQWEFDYMLRKPIPCVFSWYFISCVPKKHSQHGGENKQKLILPFWLLVCSWLATARDHIPLPWTSLQFCSSRMVNNTTLVSQKHKGRIQLKDLTFLVDTSVGCVHFQPMFEQLRGLTINMQTLWVSAFVSFAFLTPWLKQPKWEPVFNHRGAPWGDIVTSDTLHASTLIRCPLHRGTNRMLHSYR